MDVPALPSDAFRLGDLVVVPSLNRLLRGGEATDVEPRVMRVLETLAATPGEVVPRADLFDAVWPDVVVGDEALTRAVSELRKALRDGAPEAVETIRGTGYRLALPVRPLADATERTREPTAPSAERGTRRRPGVAAALVLAAVALAVAVWAAWPRLAPTASVEPDPPASAEPLDPARRPAAGYPTVLDSTSPFYRPGMSEHGVYYDSTTDRYFRFSDDEAAGDTDALPPVLGRE